MAFTLAELVVKIRADDGQMQRALPALQTKLKRIQVSMERVSRVARRMFLVVGGVMALMIKQASTAEEMHAKFMTVFRDEGEAVSKWAAQYGKSVGRSKVDMETWLATIQDTFVPLGISRREATKLSKVIVKLGIDLASFNEEADVAVIGNLQSALVGQSRAVLKYGIVIRESAVKQEVWRMGVRKAWDDVSIATKVQARMNIILQSSTDAQGDAIRTIASFANQMKMLLATLKDASAVIGRVFFPSVIRLMAGVRGLIGPIGNWVQRNQRLTATIGLVTLGVLGLLSVLPLLIASLSVLAAHPILAAIIAIGAAAAATSVYLYAMKAAAVEAFAFERPFETIKQLERRLDMLYKLKKDTERELAAVPRVTRTLEQRVERGALTKDIDTYTAAIERLVPRLKLLRAAEAEAERAREKAAKAAEAAAEKAEEATVTALAAAAKESKLAEEKLALTQKQAKAEAERVAIILRANEAIAAGAAERAQERAMARTGAGRMAPAISGIAAFARQIQEAVFRKGEDAAQKRRDEKAMRIADEQLTAQETMVELLKKFTPGLSLGP